MAGDGEGSRDRFGGFRCFWVFRYQTGELLRKQHKTDVMAITGKATDARTSPGKSGIGKARNTVREMQFARSSEVIGERGGDTHDVMP